MDPDDVPAHPLDDRRVTARVFFPRRDDDPTPRAFGVEAHRVPVDADVRLSARFLVAHERAPNALFFHGNGEVASDYDDAAPLFAGMVGVNLLVLDYRGYGSSDGEPTFGAMLRDAPAAFDWFVDHLDERGFGGPVHVVGRSLGSAPAVEVAARRRRRVTSLVLDSAFAEAAPLLELLGVPSDLLAAAESASGLVDNAAKLAPLDVPLLVVHGGRDRIVPPWHARALHDSSPAKLKRLVVVPTASHNTLLLHEEYARELKRWFSSF
ncbi:MAG: alpha/beta hydrolase [Promethearchaeota archaeon]